MREQADTEQLTSLTVDIVSAYVSNNPVPRGELSDLIANIHKSLVGLNANQIAAEPAQLVPAVTAKKSVRADYIICLEDGKKFKSLKRHLKTRYNLTPAEYRQKWNLPSDYPMVSPNYAAARSALAKTMGLGRRLKTVRPPPTKRSARNPASQ